MVNKAVIVIALRRPRGLDSPLLIVNQAHCRCIGIMPMHHIAFWAVLMVKVVKLITLAFRQVALCIVVTPQQPLLQPLGHQYHFSQLLTTKEDIQVITVAVRYLM